MIISKWCEFLHAFSRDVNPQGLFETQKTCLRKKVAKYHLLLDINRKKSFHWTESIKTLSYKI